MNLSFRHYYWRWTRNLVCLAFIVIIAMTVARLGFAFYFSDIKTLFGSLTAFKEAMILGLRYDLMPLAYINILPFTIINLCYFIPGKITIKGARFFIITILSVGYLLLGWIYLFDYSFYSYFQEHLNILFFGFFEDDTQALLISLWKNYNLPLFLTTFLIFHYGLYRFIKFLFSPFDFDLKEKKLDYRMPLVFISGLVFLAFTARGNFSRLPLSLEDSRISSNEFFNKLPLNGVLTFNRAIKIRKTFGEGEFDYLSRNGYQNWQSAFTDAFGTGPVDMNNLPKSLIRKVPGSPGRKPHVVLIVMESFGSYWNQFDAPDFNILGDLKSHFDQGLLFENFLPSENGTIGSIVSVATSQVIRPGARFLSESDLMKVKLSTAGHLPFKQAGYDTHFVYGGKLGWRDLGKYLAVQNYDHLWGAEEIKEAMPEITNIRGRDLGNEWGIFDEYLYNFLSEQLRTASRPQFFLVLTTSNHPPFEYPTTYNVKDVKMSEAILNRISVPEDIALKRFLGVQYANQKAAEFLSYINNGPLKNDVITALTGDHSYWIAKGVGAEEEFKRYAVPFFISLPSSFRPAKVDLKRFASHEDIFPSLYSLALPGQKVTALGESLFDSEPHAMNSSGLVANRYGAYHHGQYWKWKDLNRQILEPAEETPELQELRKHQEGLISITDQYLKGEKSRKPTGGESDRRE
jgi:phosphoglycerol transferase MdoB-like AlkP superfamily enzyme